MQATEPIHAVVIKISSRIVTLTAFPSVDSLWLPTRMELSHYVYLCLEDAYRVKRDFMSRPALIWVTRQKHFVDEHRHIKRNANHWNFVAHRLLALHNLIGG